MRITITLLLITLTTFSGRPAELEQIIESKPAAPILKSILEPIKKATDTLRDQYFEQVKIANLVTDKLITEKKKVDAENAMLRAEVKRLKQELKNNVVYIYDTTFKKRKFLQLFKN